MDCCGRRCPHWSGSWAGTWLAARRTSERAVNPVTRLTMNLRDGSSADLRIRLSRPFIPLALSPDGARIAWCAGGTKVHSSLFESSPGLRPERYPARRSRRLPSSRPTADGSASGPTECSGGSPCPAAPLLTSAEHRCRFSQSGGHTTKSSTTWRCPFRCGPSPPKVASRRRSTSARPLKEKGLPSTPSYPAAICSFPLSARRPPISRSSHERQESGVG